MAASDWDKRIHERLLAGDPVAPAELAEALIEPLYKTLRKNHALRDGSLVRDAATDALLSYVKRPAQYDPSKRGLLGYLVMAAEGDLKNALAKVSRRRAHEIAVDDVELRQFAGKDVPRVADAHMDLVAKEAAALDEALFTDPRDREAVALITARERSTAAFVEVWGLQGLGREEQRREVKRRKDRIKKVLERRRGDE